jgi:hypothetical protein
VCVCVCARARTCVCVSIEALLKNDWDLPDKNADKRNK